MLVTREESAGDAHQCLESAINPQSRWMLRFLAMVILNARRLCLLLILQFINASQSLPSISSMLHLQMEALLRSTWKVTLTS